MKCEHHFYNCSKEYLAHIDSDLFDEVEHVVSLLPKRNTQAEINQDLFWLLTQRGWAYDTLGGIGNTPPKDLGLTDIHRERIEKMNDRSLCVTAMTLEASWHCDFAKLFPLGLAQVEVQFGKVETMFKDFCGFRLAHYEKRLALGVEIVMHNPYGYFAHRRNAIGGMAYFDIAKNTLPAIGLDCPIWLLGIKV